MRIALLSDMHAIVDLSGTGRGTGPRDRRSKIAVEFRCILFDVEELVEVARSKDFPGFERWAAMWKR